MFLTLRSPFGGKELTSIWRAMGSEANSTVVPDAHPTMVGDYLAWKIGYASDVIRKGDSIHIKRSDAEKLWALLRIQFGE